MGLYNQQPLIGQTPTEQSLLTIRLGNNTGTATVT